MSAEKLVELCLNREGGKGSRVVVHGQDVTGLTRGVRLSSEVGEVTKLTLDLSPTVVRAQLLTEVAVDEMTHEFLIAIGWTPPVGGEL